MSQPKAPARTRNTPARTPALSEQLAARAPHFKSFEHIKDARVRRAKEVEQFLIFVAEMLPECARDLQPIINDASRRAAHGIVSTADLILEAMSKPLPPTTMEEFIEDLGLPYTTIYDNLMRLASLPIPQVIVTERKREVEPAGKRGGARKPELLFRLAH